MITKIQKWGNSQGIRFPREILLKANISVGDDVDITVQTGKILVKPTSIKRGKYKLNKLLAKIPSDYKPKEYKWGKMQGKEIW